MCHLIDVAAGRSPADLVIKNCKVVDVYGGIIIAGSIAIVDGVIAGIGDYEGRQVFDAGGRFASPGFTDSHIHIESSYVSPEEIGRLLVPHGATTIIADPHEIVNVCGIAGLDYMLEAARNTVLDIKFMIPSCVPATPWEHAGAIIDAKAIESRIDNPQILGLGEFMNFPGVVTGKGVVSVKRSLQGEFLYDPQVDVVKIAVVERHQNTGNVALGLLRGYGIRKGAIALSIAHDSHNIIVVGVDDGDMAFAVEALIRQGGGMLLARDGQIVEAMPMPIAGLMSD